MSGWEYKVVPAPTKGLKARGVKGPEGRFANAIETLMNDMGAEGWEYQRAETLPSVERSGLTGSTTEWRNILVFRRAVTAPLDDFEPELLPPPAPSTPEPEMAEEPSAEGEAETQGEDSPVEAPKQDEVSDEAAEELASEAQVDNGVEDTDDMGDMTASLKNLAEQRSAAKADD